MGTALLILLLCVADFCAGGQHYGSEEKRTPCTTPKHEEGVCTVIQNCPLLLNLKKNPQHAARKLLIQSQCGWEKRELKVCCPKDFAVDSRRSEKILQYVSTSPPEVPKTAERSDVSSDNIKNHPAWNLLPPRNKCGKSYSPRIFGGNTTRIGQYPWMVLLKYEDHYLGNYKTICGGSLINKRYVLTAAHCIHVNKRHYTLTAVVVGEHNTKKDPDCEKFHGIEVCAAPIQEIAVEEAISHPGYNVRSEKNFSDIGVIRLQRDVTFQGFLLNPICFPRDEMLSNSYVGHNAVVAGWGLTEKGSHSPVLLKVVLQVVNTSVCKPLYGSGSQQMERKVLCAGEDDSKDSCTGDSGGPLMITSQLQHNHLHIGSMYLLGVVAYGIFPCGQTGWPAVYTSVPQHAAWILDQMKA